MVERGAWVQTSIAGAGSWFEADLRADTARRRAVKRVTIALACLAAIAMLLEPRLGFVVAGLVLMLAAIDWRLSNPAMVAVFAALVVFVPGDLRMSGGLPVDVSADRLALAALVGAYIVSLVKASDEPLSSAAARVGRPLLALFGIAVLSLAINMDTANDATGGGVKGLLTLGSYIALYYLVVTIISREDVLPICRVIVASSGVVAFTAMIERFTMFNALRTIFAAIPGMEMAELGQLLRGEGIRVAATAEHPIAYGGLMAMVLPLGLYLMFSEKKHRAWWLVATAFIGGSMMLSVSRSALVAGAIGYLTLFAVWPKRRMQLATLALAGLLGVHMLFPGVIGAFQATFSADYLKQAESVENPYNRVSDYPRVKAIIPNQPLLGLGYNAFDPVTYFFLDNQLLKFVLEVGFLGTFAAVLFVWRASSLIVGAIRFGPPDERGLAAALFGAVLSFAVLSVFFDTFGFSQITWMFFLLAALGVRLASRPEGRREIDDGWAYRLGDVDPGSLGVVP